MTFTKFIAVVMLLCVFGCNPEQQQTPKEPTPTAVAPAPAGVHGKVVGIVDGDTIDVLLEGNTTKRIRFNAIDTPERGQPFGNNAKDYLSETIGGRSVLITDEGEDRYERQISDVYLGERYINAELVRVGLAWHYKTYSADAGLARDEDKAREQGIGLWSDPRHVAPWDWRKLSKEERDTLR